MTVLLISMSQWAEIKWAPNNVSSSSEALGERSIDSGDIGKTGPLLASTSLSEVLEAGAPIQSHSLTATFCLRQLGVIIS